MTAIRKMGLFQILIYLFLASLFTNCISDDYNLKNGVNTDLTLGGDSLSFPLAKTSPILLSMMLKSDSSNTLKKATDGTYSFQMKDSSVLKVKNINPVTFSIEPFVIPPVSSVYLGVVPPPSGVLSAKSGSFSIQSLIQKESYQPFKMLSGKIRALNKSLVTSNSLYFDIPIQTFDINISKFVSTDVKRINSFSLKSPSQLTFSIQISNMHQGIDSLYFSNYVIKLPAFIKFNDPDVNSSNELVLNNVGFKVNLGYTKILTYELLDFNSENGIPLTNGYFNLNRTATMQGTSYIRATNLTGNQIGAFLIQPSIIINDMVVSLIDGEIKPAIDSTIKQIKINLPNIFKQPGNVLDIQNPVITLQVGNSMGFSVNAALSMTPQSNGLTINSDTIPKLYFTVPPAVIVGQTTWTNYWISKSDTGVSSGYQPLVSPKLPDLLRIAPDNIVINVASVITGDRQHVDLYSQKNQLNINYNVNVPLDFGKDFNILYLDTLTDLKKNLDQLIKLTKQVEFVAFIDNQIPLNLNFEVIPMNNLFQVIKGITVTIPDTIKSCNPDGTSQRSILDLKMTETVAGSLNQLDAIQFRVWAKKNTTIAGLILKANQSMVVEMRVKLPKGITITKN
jgi:hypothetical protein